MKIMYRMGIFIICMSLAALFALSGCTSSDDDHSSSSSTTVTANEPTLVKSDVERDTSPDVAGEDIATLVEDNTAFTFDLYHILVDEKPDENRFFSPYSISLCSAMVYGGARNNTETQMKDALHYTLNQDTLHPAFNALSLDLTSREQDYNDDGEKDFQLNIVNSMWGQTDYDFLPEYLDLLAGNYGAGIRLVDLQNQPDSSSAAINDWVSEQTEGLINGIVVPTDFNQYSLFVLVNAIYFKARWASAFEEAGTVDDVFYTPEGEVPISMMNKQFSVNYSEGDNYQAAELAYLGNTAGMLVLLPREGKFDEFEASLTSEKLAQIIEELEYEEVILKFPKFECEPELIDLIPVFSQMGMTDAFIFRTADFSGMDGVPLWIYLHFAKHKAFIRVDEQGTEAAAVTAIGGGGGGYGDVPETEFIVNRPFIFFIRDRVTGTIIFMGRILDPS